MVLISVSIPLWSIFFWAVRSFIFDLFAILLFFFLSWEFFIFRLARAVLFRVVFFFSQRLPNREGVSTKTVEGKTIERQKVSVLRRESGSSSTYIPLLVNSLNPILITEPILCTPFYSMFPILLTCDSYRFICIRCRKI